MKKSALLLGMCGIALVATSCGTATTTSNMNTNSDSMMMNENVNSMMMNDNASGMMMNDNSSAMMNNNSSAMMDSSDGVMVGGAMMVRTLDIVDNAAKASNVTTLVAAVKAAGLVETLKGAGPFTVFAPTDAAFAKLPAGTVDTLVMPENKAQLTNILTYHVVPGRYTAADMKDGQTLTTVQGETLTVKKSGTSVMINGSAMVETADVISSNGVTHVIDSVLMPQ